MNASMLRCVGILACVVLVNACCRTAEKEKREQKTIESASISTQPAATEKEAKEQVKSIEMQLEKATNAGADLKYPDEYAQCAKDFERILTAYYSKRYEIVMYLAGECKSKINTLEWMVNNPLTSAASSTR